MGSPPFPVKATPSMEAMFSAFRSAFRSEPSDHADSIGIILCLGSARFLDLSCKRKSAALRKVDRSSSHYLMSMSKSQSMGAMSSPCPLTKQRHDVPVRHSASCPGQFSWQDHSAAAHSSVRPSDSRPASSNAYDIPRGTYHILS